MKRGWKAISSSVALEAVTPGAFALENLDKIDVTLQPCGHPMRVLRHRIGEQQPCVPCELETGTLTMRTITAAGPLPPPRKEYRPPVKHGFVEGGYTPPPNPMAFVERINARRAADPRTHTQRLADEQAADRKAGIVVKKKKAPNGKGKGWSSKAASVPDSLTALKAMVEQRGGEWVTTKEWDRDRPEGTVTARTILRHEGRDWAALLKDAGVVKTNNRSIDAARTAALLGKLRSQKERMENSTAAILAMAADLGRTPTCHEWNDARDKTTTLTNSGIVYATKMQWNEWIHSLGLPQPETKATMPGRLVYETLKAEWTRRGIKKAPLMRETGLSVKAVETRWREWRNGKAANIALVRQHFEPLGLSVDDLLAKLDEEVE
jgi:hypothetical protein